MLDATVALLPSPLDVPPFEGIDPRNDKKITLKAENDEPLSALVFKIATDPFVGRLAYLRVYSGTLQEGVMVYNPRTDKKDRINRLYHMHANKQNPRSEVYAGDIVGAVGLKNLKTGDTLCSVSKPVILESMDFQEPFIKVAIEPKTQGDIDRLSLALAKLMEEDPTFQVRTDSDTGQTIISGMGELHLEILVDRLKREFKVECNQGQPQVNYKEAISAMVEHREVFKKQTGGRGKFADIVVKIEPAPDGTSGLIFTSEIKGGNVPKEFIPSIEKGFNAAMLNGPLAGFPVDGLKVTLLDAGIARTNNVS